MTTTEIIKNLEDILEYVGEIDADEKINKLIYKLKQEEHIERPTDFCG